MRNYTHLVPIEKYPRRGLNPMAVVNYGQNLQLNPGEGYPRLNPFLPVAKIGLNLD